MALIKFQAGLTLPKALSEGVQLSALRKQDADTLIAVLSALIHGLAKSLNLGKSMDEMQAYEAASLLADKFWHLKLEEIILVFKRAKLGEYGPTYNRLDVQVIAGWLARYDHSEEKAAYLERVRAMYRQKEKQSLGEGASPERVKRLLALLSPDSPATPSPKVTFTTTEAEDLAELQAVVAQMTSQELAYVKERYYTGGWAAGLAVIEAEITRRQQAA